MTEQSAYWDGLVTGDATGALYTAPYSSAEFSDILNRAMSGAITTGHVVPIAPNFNLDVVADSPASMTVKLKPGNAIIGGRLYRNTAELSLTLSAADPANPRIDRIILRVDTTAQTIRAVVLTGTPGGTPGLPGLTIAGNIHEITLAYIWVAAAAVSVDTPDIHDERIYLLSHYELWVALGRNNMIRNSEYMAFSALSATPAAGGGPPDAWTQDGAGPTFAAAAKPAQMVRGRAVQITAAAGSDGMIQFPRATENSTHTLKVLVNVTAGDVGRINIQAGATNVTKHIRRTGAWIEEQITFSVPAGTTAVTLRLGCLNLGDIVSYGQAIMVEGYAVGPFRDFRETIPLTDPIGDAAWNTTAKSTGATTIDLDADFQALILPGTRAIFILIECNDSGSAASTTTRVDVLSVNSVAAQHTVWVAGAVNDRKRAGVGLVQVFDNLNTFSISVTASGAGTLDVLARIVGIVV